MPRPRTSLKSFLHSAKSILTAPSSTSRPPVTFVIGNESADVDSICSSILLAYLKTYSPHPHRNYPDTFYIPLSNIPRADLRLRPELLPVLKHAHLDTDDVLTLSDLPFPIEKDDGSELARDSKWFLVDHNVLTGSLGTRFGNKVVGIIDHHFNEYEHPLTHDPVHGEGRAIEGVGSCASLIIQHARKANMFPARNQAWDEELACLGIAAILIDTDDLKNEDKTVQMDFEAVEFWEGMVTHGIREELVKEVREGKGDLDGLSLEEVLRKDFKQWSEGGMVLGLAAVVKPLGYLVEKVGGDEEFLGGVKKWAEERDLGGGKKGVGLMGVMTTFSDEEGVFKRELFLWALSEGGEKAGRRFEEEAGEKLGLKAYEGGKWDGDGEDDVRWRRCWVQERTENSRKQVAPLLREAMK